MKFMKNALILSTLILSASIANAQVICPLYPFQQLSGNSSYALGPLMANYYYTIPQVANAIESARSVWNSTDANGRLAGPSVWVTTSDCPTGQPFQLGIYSFSSSSCPALTKHNVSPNTLAFVDYHIDPLNTSLGVASRSVSINLDLAWSDNPNTSQYDLQGLMTHEFGHVLGLAHAENGWCGVSFQQPTCSSMPPRETMHHLTHMGETCSRTLETHDVYNANHLY